MQDKSTENKSVIKQYGFKTVIDGLIEELTSIYLSDEIPWVVGYSGGKDSTAVLQLVWMALSKLDKDKLSKPVHVISTDTLVENPVVAAWVNGSLEQIKIAAEAQNLPIYPHLLFPEVGDTFWVNLIGKGYPAPKSNFRWCTERLKIKPSNEFIKNVVRENGEAIVVLGTRRAESANRARSMEKLAQNQVREKLNVRPNLINSLVYSPIEDWTNDDVWMFLMQVKNSWGYSNKDLMTMYKGASTDGECPLVVDTTTPSCGNSRFGCWVCTVVDKDRSMEAMVTNTDDNGWMEPLLDLRNELDERRNRKELRDFRRMDGSLTLHNDDLISGPYTQAERAFWLKRILEAQKEIRENGPFDNVELITMPELQEIRRIWVVDKHEIEDKLPQIYEEATGEKYPEASLDDNLSFGAEEMRLLEEVCGDDRILYELTRELIDVERRFKTLTKRAGLYPAMEKAFRRNFYNSREDALERASNRQEIKETLKGEKSDSLKKTGVVLDLQKINELLEKMNGEGEAC